MYNLHPILDQTDMMIHQHLFWPIIREAVQSEIKHYDSFQNKKNDNKKYVKIPTKLVENSVYT